MPCSGLCLPSSPCLQPVPLLMKGRGAGRGPCGEGRWHLAPTRALLCPMKTLQGASPSAAAALVLFCSQPEQSTEELPLPLPGWMRRLRAALAPQWHRQSPGRQQSSFSACPYPRPGARSPLLEMLLPQVPSAEPALGAQGERSCRFPAGAAQQPQPGARSLILLLPGKLGRKCCD